MKPTIDPSQIADLKQQAYDLKTKEGITQAQALDRVAQAHKFENWRELTKVVWRELPKAPLVDSLLTAVPAFDCIADLIKENKRIEGHFFDDSKIEGELYTNEYTAEQYFITSEQRDNDPRRYTIRQALRFGKVKTYGVFQAYMCLDDAIGEVCKLIGTKDEVADLFPRYTGMLLPSIVREVKEDAVNEEEPITYLKDIVANGCVVGSSPLHWYDDTNKFFETHKDEINSWLGSLNPMLNIRYSKWDPTDPLLLENNNKCLIAWDAYETAAKIILDLKG